jgi:hypothetical protein
MFVLAIAPRLQATRIALNATLLARASGLGQRLPSPGAYSTSRWFKRCRLTEETRMI